MATHNLVQQAIKRAAVIQQLADVPTEVLEILPAVCEALERVGFDPLVMMEKLIKRAERAEAEAREAKHAESS